MNTSVFRIFNHPVERRFTLLRYECDRYTDYQLSELIPYQLRTFMIMNTPYFLAKDVCSFLGIPPGDVCTSMVSINRANVRYEDVTLFMYEPRQNVTMLDEVGVYALIKESSTIRRSCYAKKFKSWFSRVVLPSIDEDNTLSIAVLRRDIKRLSNDNRAILAKLNTIIEHTSY